MTVRIPAQNAFTFTLFGFDISYDAEKSILRCLDQEAPVKGKNGLLTIHLIIDTVNTEVFADDGSIFMGMTYIQDYNLNTLSIASNSPIDQIDITIAELNAFWRDAK